MHTSFQEQVCSAMMRFQGRAQLNIARARILTKIAEDLLKGDDSHHKNDIFRAVVVFLHAAVEDFLRNVGVERLPKADAAFLDEISLLGTDPKTTFSLGRLSEHRGKTVDELLAQSVNAHLQRSTFNNRTQVIAFLTRCKIDWKETEKFFPDLQAMMERRHRIVHQADFDQLVWVDGEKPERIELADLVRWTTAATDFVNTIAGRIVADLLWQRCNENKITAAEVNAAFQEAASRMTMYLNQALK